MKIRTRCEHCGKVYQTNADNLGQTAQCRHCQNYFTMTLLEGPPAPEPPQAQQPPAPQPQSPNQPPASGQPAAYGQGTPSQPFIETQAVVCPKCNYTADIPRISRKLKLTCQECGHKFLVKPGPKNQPGRPLPTEKAPKERGSSKAPIFLFLLLLLGIIVVVPQLFPELGLPNLLDLF